MTAAVAAQAQEVWIAIDDTASEGTYVCDNQEVTYTHWSNDNPNNYGGNQVPAFVSLFLILSCS